MQTSKLNLVICVVTLLTGVSILYAVETEAQKKAREALRQKWQELDGQAPPARPPAPAALEPPAAAPPPAVAPVTPPPPAPVAAPRSADSEAQAKARAALRQKYNEDQFGQPIAPATGTASSAALAWTPGAADNPAQAKAREALWQKVRELDSQQPVAPPPSISGAKAGRLAELLRQYRADQIAPEDYHKQRAAILAEK
jgi:hypothetical protein